MPSWPLGVPELSSELGRRRRKSFRLVLLLRLSVCAGAGMWNPSRLNTVLPDPRKDWRLTFNFRSDSPLVPSGGCFHPCASKCATWTRASSTTLPWMSCRWTPNATGVCVCVCVTWVKVIIHLLVYLRLRARSLQVRVPQLSVDGGGEHGPLVHLPAPLRAPGLSVRGGDVDASGHQLWPGQAHQQRDGRQGTCR